MTAVIAIGAVVLAALLAADFLFYRMMIRALFRLVDLLPPLPARGRYRSYSMPEWYDTLRSLRSGS